MTMANHWPKVKEWVAVQGPCNYKDYNDYSQREKKETTGGQGDSYDRSYDYGHYDMSLCVLHWSPLHGGGRETDSD